LGDLWLNEVKLDTKCDDSFNVSINEQQEGRELFLMCIRKRTHLSARVQYSASSRRVMNTIRTRHVYCPIY